MLLPYVSDYIRKQLYILTSGIQWRVFGMESTCCNWCYLNFKTSQSRLAVHDHIRVDKLYIFLSKYRRLPKSVIEILHHNRVQRKLILLANSTLLCNHILKKQRLCINTHNNKISSPETRGNWTNGCDLPVNLNKWGRFMHLKKPNTCCGIHIIPEYVVNEKNAKYH